MDYKNILSEIGYSNIIDNGRELRMKPIYRDSSSNTVLSVRKDSGYFIDFSKNISGSFHDLVKLSLKLKSAEEAKKWLSNGHGESDDKVQKHQPKIRTQRVFSKEPLDKILPRHKYWIDRGVPEEIVRIFRGGEMTEKGKMKDRYVFPIFNWKEELIGISGRYLHKIEEGSKIPKWKHYGDKSKCNYPLFFNHKIIRNKKKVILVESIGDMLALWTCGHHNVMVTFGLDVSVSMINTFLKFDMSKIIVAFNNDSENNNAGNEAARKVHKKMLKYFDPDQVSVHLPQQKDFGEMNDQEIEEWANEANCNE